MTDYKSAQEIFDTIVSGLFEQGGPALGDNGICKYRTEIGRKCAAGLLIAEEAYQEDFEGHTAQHIARTHPNAMPGVNPDDVKSLAVIRQLQLAHDDLARASKDDTFFMIQFPREARRIAALKGIELSTAKLDALAWPK